VNTLFNIGEQAEISEQIQQIKAWIKKTYELSGEQWARVKARLDEADQASRRIGRKDWRIMFYGTGSSLILSNLIPPRAAQHILVLTVHGRAHLFGIGDRHRLHCLVVS
jgi:hypothetical protein